MLLVCILVLTEKGIREICTTTQRSDYALCKICHTMFTRKCIFPREGCAIYMDTINIFIIFKIDSHYYQTTKRNPGGHNYGYEFSKSNNLK